MFDKFREKRALKKNQPVAELIEWQETALKEIEENVTAAESIEDPADKILALQAIIRTINTQDTRGANKQEAIAEGRAKKKSNKIIGAAGGVVATGLTVPAAMLAPPLIPIALMLGVLGAEVTWFGNLFALGRMEDTKLKKMIEKNPILTYFGNMLATQQNRAQQELDHTINNCDLERLPLSSRFDKVISECTPLRKRFNEATTAAAKKALLEKETTQVQEEKLAKTPKAIGSYTAPALKK